MKIDISGLEKSGREFILSQLSLTEIFRELHRRAVDDVEEDEEVDWEDEVSSLYKQRLEKHYPHLFKR